MKLINSKIFFYESQLAFSFNQETIKKSRDRGKIYFVKDPEDNRKILIQFDSLKDTYKQKIINDLCGGLDPYEFYHAESLENHLILKPSDGKFFDEFNFNHDYALQDRTIQVAKEYCRYIYFLARHKRASIKKESFPGWTVDQFWSYTIAHIKANQSFRDGKHGVNIAASRGKLVNYTNKYIELGPGIILSGKLNNKNSAKIGKKIMQDTPKNGVFCEDTQEIQISKLKDMWSLNRRFTSIAEDYNNWAKLEGFPLLSARSVRHILNRPEIRKELAGEKHGTIEGLGEFGYKIPTQRPSKPLIYVNADGTPYERFYKKTGYRSLTDREMEKLAQKGYRLEELKKKQRKIRKYYERKDIIIVSDVFMDFPLGIQISDSENFDDTKRAFKNAVDYIHALTGRYYNFYQIRTDRFVHNSMKEFCSLVTPNEKKFYTPSKARHPWSKPIEAWFGRLRQEMTEKSHEHSGGNITSKSHVNKDWLDKIKKFFPDELQVVYLIYQDIVNWRNKKLKNNKTREQIWLENFQKNEKYYRNNEITRARYLEIYGERAENNTLGTSGLCPRIMGEKKIFMLMDEDFFYPGTEFEIYFDPINTSDILAVNTLTGKKFVVPEFRKPPVAILDHEGGDRAYLQRLWKFQNEDMKRQIVKQKRRHLVLETHGEKSVREIQPYEFNDPKHVLNEAQKMLKAPVNSLKENNDISDDDIFDPY